MTDHPEQELIKTIIMGDLAGVDETNYKEYYDALKQLSEDGKIELEKQRVEVFADVKRQQEQYWVLDDMPDTGTRH